MKERIRIIVGGFQDTTMFLVVAVWMCIVPLVLLFTLPFFGWQGGLTAAVVTFLLALALCWAVCLYPQIADPATPALRRTPNELRSFSGASVPSGTHTEEK